MTYQDFFKLKDTPFRLTPDLDYFFQSEGHGNALETLLYSIRNGEGFVQITGRPGVGKTMLVRHLLNQLGDKVKTALILHPRLNAEDLLKVILEDLGISSQIIQNSRKIIILSVADFVTYFPSVAVFTGYRKMSLGLKVSFIYLLDRAIRDFCFAIDYKLIFFSDNFFAFYREKIDAENNRSSN